jgi:hypothetical protein
MALLLTIIEQDGTTISAEIASAQQTLDVVADIRLDGDRIVLYNFHIDGPGAGVLGIVSLRRIVDQVMEVYDVASLEIHGFRRTTGASPGRIPGPLCFARRGGRS